MNGLDIVYDIITNYVEWISQNEKARRSSSQKRVLFDAISAAIKLVEDSCIGKQTMKHISQFIQSRHQQQHHSYEFIHLLRFDNNENL
jgi:hypothetical protein